MNLVVLSLFIFVVAPQNGLFEQNEAGAISFQETDRFVLYIGTNDKDTNEALISVDEARKIVDDISQRYTDGFTSLSAEGHWNSPQDIWVSEDTLVYIYYAISEDQVADIADEIIVALNQYSVMIERGAQYSAYYPSD